MTHSETQSVELKACPWCGSDNVEVERTYSTAMIVMCSDCLAGGPNGGSSEAEAVTLWNTRTQEKQS